MAKAAVKIVQEKRGQDPSVHLLVRTIAEPPMEGSVSGAEYDAVLSSWTERGYKIVHANSEIESIPGAVPQFRAVILVILEMALVLTDPDKAA